jgi:hypothetical protein
MTYLELVNNVLRRLRENTVSTVTERKYSTLIGQFVNDAKRQVEDAWQWDAQYTTIPVITTVGVNDYLVVGSGLRYKDTTVNCVTAGRQTSLTSVSYKWIQNQLQLLTLTNGIPVYYAWNGNDGTDSTISLYPTPDGTYTMNVNLCVPQLPLSADSDVLQILPEAVELLAWARAAAERGEDGGLSSSEISAMARSALSDQIAIEVSRDASVAQWSVV